MYAYRDQYVAQRLGEMADRFAEVRAAEEWARNIPDAKRKQLAKEGKALADGSYPIENEGDLRNAETLAKSGHGNVSAATALIKKRARELGVKHNMGGK